MRDPAELTRAFRERGLRITPQRVAVFEALHGRTGHPTAELIYDAVAAGMPSISLRTVYQTLNDLTEMGEIKRLDMAGGASRFDPNVDDHHHLVCDECGLITDAYLDISAIEFGDLDGFLPSGAKVFVSGRCARCAATPAGERAMHDRPSASTSSIARAREHP